MLEWIVAVTLGGIAVVHSYLGERALLRPLFAQSSLEGKYPTWVTTRVLRFAWHLTSVAWMGLAVIVVGVQPLLTVAGVMIVSAAVILWRLPSHLAWIPFLVGGLVAWWSGGPIPAPMLWTGLGIGVAIAVIAGAFHVAWALGSKKGIANVLPQQVASQQPVSIPPRLLTAAIAAALFSYATIAVLASQTAIGPIRWAAIAALVVFCLRVIGEGRYVGAFKSIRGTGFSRADDRYWTPIVAMLALSAASALVLGNA